MKNMNWRKPLIYSLLHLSRNNIPRNLKEIYKYERLSRQEIDELANDKLSKLLLHAYENVPYYHNILSQCGVIDGGKVKLENFSNIPVLTKEIIKKEGKNLYSIDYKKRKPYSNTSGGSTGEPVRFVQDANYDQANTAIKLYFNVILGKDVGEREIKFWGSDRDIIEGCLTVKDRMINFLYNRKFFNSYRLNEQTINELINLNNRFKPVAYWSYMESALELAKYLARNDISFHSPRILISTIGPLTEKVKQEIELGMKCNVYNQYGSREVGVIACQCKSQKGMHTFPWWNKVEILNEQYNAVDDQQGDVVVTTLHNYSMPLIRYKIGDVAIGGGYKCSCGRNTFLLDKVVGRTLGYFKKSDGSLVHSHFIVQALFFMNWIKMFQIIQDELDHIVINIELYENKKPTEKELKEITSKVKILMGPSCEVDFEFVDSIKRTASGKYMYTLCKVKN